MEIYVDENNVRRCRAGEVEPAWIVKAVVPKDDYTLLLTFIRGEKKVMDMKPLIKSGKMYRAIKNPEIFKLAHIEGPTVVWTPEIDIAPEYLYNKSQASR